MNGSGDCFRKAVEVAESMPGARVCHGTPIGSGPLNFGKRYWHAWVEVRTSSGWLVLDWSNGKKHTMPRRDYYAGGRIDPAEVHRYSLAEVRAQLVKHEQWGPWVDGWQTAAL